MYLKRLELIGFKSFAARTVVDFNGGVTSVVGPNGCGKSNISDAIKWVLGEQSAKTLRGGKMEDVIFNGTLETEPVNVAEVSVVFSNEQKRLPIDFEEVVITRRLYRDGSSEYLINKSIVRLKDIQSLLAGTGLGVGNYSVIEQGRIDRVLNAKPEDRRLLFEEAAGITRFKTQKKETLRNLEATEQNLQRVTDIIKELQRQIASLERQAKKAENYKRDYACLKQYDIRTAHKERKRIKAEKEGISGRFAAARQTHAETDRELGELNSKLNEAREALRSVDQQYTEARAKHLVAENQIKSNDEKRDIFTRYIDEGQQKLNQLEHELVQQRERLSAMQAEEETIQGEVSRIREEQERGTKQRNDAEIHFAKIEGAIRQLKEDVCGCETQLQEAERQKSRLENGLTQTAQQEESLKAQVLERIGERESLGRRRAEITEKKERTADEEESVQALCAERDKAKSDLEKSLKDSFEKRKSLSVEIKSVLADISSLGSKREVLKELQEKLEGYSSGARWVLEQAKSDPGFASGILGSLADKIRVKEGYEAAMEAALGQATQAVVCRSKADVASVMRRIRERNPGAVVLMRADEELFEVSGIVESYLFEEGVKRITEFAEAESQVSPTIQRLLERIYVVWDPQRAVELSVQYPSLTFVTPSGDWIQGTLYRIGNMGSAERLIIGREARIRDIEDSLTKMRSREAELESRESGEISRGTELETQLRECARQSQAYHVRLADVRSRRSHQEQELEQIIGRIESLDAMIEDLEKQRAEIKAQSYSVQSQISESSKKINEYQGLLNEKNLSLKAASAQREEFLVEMTRIRSQWETVAERLERAQQNAERITRAVRLEAESGEFKTREREELRQKLSETRNQLRGLEEAAQVISRQREELLVQHNEMTERRSEALAKVNDMQTRQESARESLRLKQEEAHRLEMECEKADNALMRLQERIRDHYQVDLDGVPEEQEQPAADPNTGEPISSMPQPAAEEMERLREKLAKVGPVNLIAVEEYGDLKERFEFLNAQRDDLLRAKEDIHRALLKINKTTREMFVETFTKIQTYFVEYYKLLFQGGNAEILLLDEGDVLESGIEIVARPPGKKLQVISLLSGGEKALTAIALMFAIFKAKPSPFCILDEIDAPLDDANVQRFTNVLHEFVKECQFIIITHNKRTMSVADVLYGVTMQRTGISSVVSVKFSEEEAVKKVSGNRIAALNKEPSEITV